MRHRMNFQFRRSDLSEFVDIAKANTLSVLILAAVTLNASSRPTPLICNGRIIGTTRPREIEMLASHGRTT